MVVEGKRYLRRCGAIIATVVHVQGNVVTYSVVDKRTGQQPRDGFGLLNTLGSISFLNLYSVITPYKEILKKLL